MTYGGQQWPTLMQMSLSEVSEAYYCLTLIKKAENDSSAKAAEEVQRENEARERERNRRARRTR